MIVQSSSKFILQKTSPRLALFICLSFLFHLLLTLVGIQHSASVKVRNNREVELVARSTAEFLPAAQQKNSGTAHSKSSIEPPPPNAVLRQELGKKAGPATAPMAKVRTLASPTSRPLIANQKPIPPKIEPGARPEAQVKYEIAALPGAVMKSDPQGQITTEHEQGQKSKSTRLETGLSSSQASSELLSGEGKSVTLFGFQPPLEPEQRLIQATLQDQSATPRYDVNPIPEYPEVARRRGYQGTVELAVLVLPDGRVGSVGIQTSSGFRILDQAARKSVRFWKFQPGTAQGVRVESRVVVPVNFVLDGE